MRFRESILFIGSFILLLNGILPGPLPAQESQKVYTLEKGIAEALANNWSLKARKEKIEQAIDVRNQARAEFLPKLGITYGYTRQSEARILRSSLPGEDIAISSQNNYAWRGTVRQPIFTGFGLLSSYELAKLGIDQSETEVELEKLDLVLRVKEAYFNILIADKAVEVAGKEVESLESNAKVARSFYKVGLIPVNEVLQAEVDLANAQQDLVRVRYDSRVTRSAFNTVLSRPIIEPVEVEDILDYRPEEVEFEEYMQRALKNRPEIKVIDIGLLQSDQQIRLAKSKYYPELALVYEYIKEGDSPNVDGSPFHDAGRWEAFATLSWTFWEWGKTYYSAREQESAKKELMQTRKALEDNIRLEVRRAVSDLEVAEENIPTTKKAVEQAEESLRVSEERYKAQVTTITEVLDAQFRLTRARVNYYRALYDHNLSRARLARALGEY
jgi:outer membrane protein TolC